MKTQRWITVTSVLLATVLVSGLAWGQTGQATRDNEKIINVQQLRAALNEATSPISQRIQDSHLMEKFDAVNQLLQEKDMDKELLLNALQDLQNEMTGFTKSWSEITEPLWQGQEVIGKTIEKVRTLLASSGTGEPTEKIKASLKNYDKRLSELATSLKKEQDEERRSRLKLVFANVLALRQLTEQAGMIDLGPAQQTVYVKIIESLSNLEMALTNSTFQIEKVRILLEGQADFVGTYVGILGGLIESEKLAMVLGEMNSAGEGLGVLTGDLGTLNTRLEQFNKNMTMLAERLAINIDAQTAHVVHVPELDDKEIEKMIEQYSSK